MDYDGKFFRGRSNSPSGEVGSTTVFEYHQTGSRLWGSYSGGEVVEGHLLGTVADDGSLYFCYHHLNEAGRMMAGHCNSTPTRAADGQLVLQENWQWFTGDASTGYSEVEEIDATELGNSPISID
ncbi:MAG: n-acetylglutamate synthase [Spirochaetaceae bacterium]|nr:MAG: n-acetylglutamate synthase [Spirochaetaceae bacterium]